MSNSKKRILALLIIIPFLGLIYFISFKQALLWLIGIGYGSILASTPFGFTTGWRDFIEKRDAGGMQAQFLLILILFILSTPILLLYPQIDPANASISFSLLIGAFVFGMFMQLANGCGSGTLYKSGSLKLFHIFTLIGFIIGAFWGSLHTPGWLALGKLYDSYNFLTSNHLNSELETISNPYPMGILIQLFLLLGGYIFFKYRFKKTTIKNQKYQRYTIGAIGLAILAWLNLLIAGQPWGVVYGLGLWGAKLFSFFGWESSLSTLYWQLGYNAESLKNSLLLDSTSMTNLGLIFGAIAVSFIGKAKNSSKNKFSKFSFHKIITPLVIGIILGYSSRLAFGCNIGAFVSGLSTGSLHGWVWFLFAFGGSLIGVKLRKLNFFNRYY